jgi:hypothetical protein
MYSNKVTRQPDALLLTQIATKIPQYGGMTVGNVDSTNLRNVNHMFIRNRLVPRALPYQFRATVEIRP